MSEVAIRIEGLGKCYRLRHQGAVRYNTLRDDLVNWMKAPFQFLSGREKKGACEQEDFWALRDISCEIKHGEVVGIIGRNGAGKSTLLKILSRLVDPTEGGADLFGRVGALLEVGTGFHPELTGRENIYLSGAILGMTRHEIQRKFDEIVTFAEIEKFLDTPAKYYSSGMYMRLGFAVAAHLEPEILVVDEVLAVGDVQFQKKCLGKMKDVSVSGRTVLFVSHNMSAIRSLCSRAILLKDGRVAADGDVEKVTEAYMALHTDSKAFAGNLAAHPGASGSKKVVFEWARVGHGDGVENGQFCIGDDLHIEFKIKAGAKVVESFLKLGIMMRSQDGIKLCSLVDSDSGFVMDDFCAECELSVKLEDMRLYPGTYYITLWVGDITSINTYHWVEECLSFEVIDGGKLTSRKLSRAGGLLFWTPEWKKNNIKQGHE